MRMKRNTRCHRISNYCEDISNSLEEFKNAKVDEGWFYQIPNLNFLILWRLSIIKHLEFDYIDDCLKAATEANELFKQLALSVGWGDLKILQLQDEILEALEYKSENIDKLQNAYELIFHDYVANSAKFFPTQLQNQILDFYS